MAVFPSYLVLLNFYITSSKSLIIELISLSPNYALRQYIDLSVSIGKLNTVYKTFSKFFS